MSIDSRIVDCGGWRTKRIVGRPKARLFGFLSLVWLCVSYAASMPFWGGSPKPFGWLEGVCLLLMLPLPVLCTLAVTFLCLEKPRVFTRDVPVRDDNLRHLF